MICRTVISQSIKDKIEGGFGERELIQDKIEGLFDFYITLDHRVVSLVERDEDKFEFVVVLCCWRYEDKLQIWRKCFFVVVVPKVRDTEKCFFVSRFPCHKSDFLLNFFGSKTGKKLVGKKWRENENFS